MYSCLHTMTCMSWWKPLRLIFLYARLDVIGYAGRVGVHTGFRTITLVLYIGSLPNLATWKGKNPIYFGVIRSRSPLL